MVKGYREYVGIEMTLQMKMSKNLGPGSDVATENEQGTEPWKEGQEDQKTARTSISYGQTETLAVHCRRKR